MTDVMRALVLTDKPRFVENHPIPTPGPDGALIRTIQAGICGTDLELIEGYASFRGVLGHEFVGVVEACQSDPQLVGQRVVGEINVACEQCEPCRLGLSTHCAHRSVLGIRGLDGAFADYFTLPVKNLQTVPDRVSDDQAIFVEPLAAGLQILNQIHVRPCDRVVVIGAGKLGLLIAQVLALTGCDLTVIGNHQAKLAILARLGIHTQASGALPKFRADLVVEATGSPRGMIKARRLVRPQGKIVLKSTYHGGSELNLVELVIDEITVVGSRCGPFAPALRLLAQNLVDVTPLIQARFPLESGAKALERARQPGVLKVLITVTSSPR